MEKVSARGLLSFGLLAAAFLVVGVSFAQTPQPVCTLDHCDSNIVTVRTQTTPPPGAATGTVVMIIRVGGVDVGSQNGSCAASLVTPSGSNTAGCVRNVTDAPVGNYSVSYLNGFPSVSNVDATKTPTVTPSGTQTLSAGSSITFYVDFQALAGTYTLSCAATPNSTDSITVLWSGNVPAPHTIQIYGSNSQITTPVSSGSIYGPVAGPGNYSFIEGSLASGTHRWYAMKTTNNSSGAVVWSYAPVYCTPSTPPPIIKDPPTNLHVDGWDRNSINITWTDNVTTNRSHHFQLERINATPLTPTNFAGVSRSSASVSFSWKNSTGYVIYNSTLERSTSADFNIRFSKSDVSMVSLSPLNEYDPLASGNSAGNPVDFSYTDSGVTEATVYYYQLKACFPDSVAGLYTPAKPGQPVNTKPDRACSGYTSTMATTTLPNAPSNLTATVTSPSAITLTWKDNSAKEEGFYIYRNSAYVATVRASDATGATLTYNDTGLNSGTSYTYTVKSFFTDPLTGVKLLSNDSNSATRITWVTLTVSNSPTSGGSISGAGINCGSGGTSCSNDFEKGYPVMLTASKADSYNFTKWTGDACNNSTYPVCSFLINSDVTVTANFTYVPPAPTDLCLNVNGIQTTTPCADTLCVAPATWSVSAQTCVTPAPTPLGDYSGDANGDGVITCADVNLINQFVANGNTGLSPTQQKWADFSRNGTVSTYDAALLSQTYNLSCSGAFLAPADAAVANLSGTVMTLVNSIGVWHANIYSSAIDSVSGWWSGLASTFKSGWNAVAGLFNGIGVKEAEAVADNIYNNYFEKTIITADSSSHYFDTGLVENSVYIYRVRVIYDDGGTPATSNWSDPPKAAGMTLGYTPPVDNCPPSGCPSAPVIYSGLTASGQINIPFLYSIKATNSPTRYGASGLPAGLSVNTLTGLISGTPSVTVTNSNITISASNAVGTDNKTLIISIFGGGGCSGSGCCVGGNCGGGGGSGVGGMCVGNNLCDKSKPTVQVTDGSGLLLGQSEFECKVNSDCADVGRYSKTIKEQ